MKLQTILDNLHSLTGKDQLISNCKETDIQYFEIDSRNVKPSTLFVALQGERVDGHDFAIEAEKKGAVAVLASHTIPQLTIPQIIVPDVLQALGKIAAYHRQQFKLPIVALTGSNGKTTTKEMIKSLLPQGSLATEGNLNNHIGVPLMLLKLNKAHPYAVFELGANHIGEIAYTANLVKPDVALITNIAPAHIGEFGSIEAIANTKGEIYEALSEKGLAVVNDDDDYAHFWDKKIGKRRTLRFSSQHASDVYAKNITTDKKGFASFTFCTADKAQQVILQVPGLHNVNNALAAMTCGLALGLPLQEMAGKIGAFKGVAKRLTFLTGQNGVTLIDDTYNANLRSVLAAIDVLAHQPGKKVLILGDMKELGDHTDAHHQTIGETARSKSIDLVFTCGEASEQSATGFGSGAIHFDTQLALIEKVKPLCNAQTTILVKGSRSAQMEKVVEALLG